MINVGLQPEEASDTRAKETDQGIASEKCRLQLNICLKAQLSARGNTHGRCSAYRLSCDNWPDRLPTRCTPSVSISAKAASARLCRGICMLGRRCKWTFRW